MKLIPQWMCHCPHPGLCVCEGKNGVEGLSAVVTAGYLSTLARNVIFILRQMFNMSFCSHSLLCVLLLPLTGVLLRCVKKINIGKKYFLKEMQCDCRQLLLKA